MGRMTKQELIDSGVDETLVDARDDLNKKIEAGLVVTDKEDCIPEYAFISNPNGYDSLFIRCTNGGIVSYWNCKEK